MLIVMIMINKGKEEANDLWAEDCASLEASLFEAAEPAKN